MNPSEKPLSTSHAPSPTVRYWSRVFTRNKLLDLIPAQEMRSFLEKFQSGDYAALGVDLKYRIAINGKHWVVMGVWVSREKRILFTQKDSTIIIIDYLDNHQYDRACIMDRAWFRTFVQTHLSTEEQVESSCVEIDTDSHDGWIPAPINIEDFDCESILPAWDYQGRFLELTPEQSISLDSLPLVVQGLAGSGKTFSGLVALLSSGEGELSEGVITSLAASEAQEETGAKAVEAPGSEPSAPLYHLLYTSNSPRLVQTEREFCAGQAQSQSTHIQMHFWSQDDYYPRAQTLLSSEILTWITAQTQSSTAHFPSLRSFHPTQLLQELHLLYALQRICPDSFQRRYMDGFVRTHLFLPEEQAAICALFEKISHTLFQNSERPYIQGFLPRNPLPDIQMETTVLDEGQNATLPELLFLALLSREHRLLILQDPKQNQEWKGIDTISLFENVFSHLFPRYRFSERKTLSVSYRCGSKILQCANTLLDLRSAVIEGVTFKDESPRVAIVQEQMHPGEVRWYPEATRGSRYDAIREALPEGSLQWAVITSKDKLHEAQQLFGDRALVLPFSATPGMQFKAVAIYGLDRAILESQSAASFRATLDENFQPKAYKSKSLHQHEEFIRYCGALLTALTRAEDLAILIEPAPAKKSSAAIKAFHKAFIKEEYKQYDRPILVNLRASTQGEWTQFIAELIVAGDISVAKSVYHRQIETATPSGFESWCLEHNIQAHVNESTAANESARALPLERSGGPCEGLPLSIDPSSPLGNAAASTNSSQKGPTARLASPIGKLPDFAFVSKYIKILMKDSGKAEFISSIPKLLSKEALFMILFCPSLSSTGSVLEPSGKAEIGLSLVSAYIQKATPFSAKRSSFSGCEMAISRIFSEPRLANLLVSEDFLSLPAPQNLQELSGASPEEPLSIFAVLLILCARQPNGLAFLLKLFNPQVKFDRRKIVDSMLPLPQATAKQVLTIMLRKTGAYTAPLDISDSAILLENYRLLSQFCELNSERLLSPAKKKASSAHDSFAQASPIDVSQIQTPAQKPTPRSKEMFTTDYATTVYKRSSAIFDILLGESDPAIAMRKISDLILKANDSTEKIVELLCATMVTTGQEEHSVLAIAYLVSSDKMVYSLALHFMKHLDRLPLELRQKSVSPELIAMMIEKVHLESKAPGDQKILAKTINLLLEINPVGMLPEVNQNGCLDSCKLLMALASCTTHPQLIQGALELLMKGPKVMRGSVISNDQITLLVQLISQGNHRAVELLLLMGFNLFSTPTCAKSAKARIILRKMANVSDPNLGTILSQLQQSPYLTPEEKLDLIHTYDRAYTPDCRTSLLEVLFFDEESRKIPTSQRTADLAKTIIQISLALLDSLPSEDSKSDLFSNMLVGMMRVHSGTCLQAIALVHQDSQFLDSILSARLKYTPFSPVQLCFDRDVEFKKTLEHQLLFLALQGAPEANALSVIHHTPLHLDLWGKCPKTNQTSLLLALANGYSKVALALLQELRHLLASGMITEEDRLDYINAEGETEALQGLSALSLALWSLEKNPQNASVIEPLITMKAHMRTKLHKGFCFISSLAERGCREDLRAILDLLSARGVLDSILSREVGGYREDSLIKAPILHRAILSRNAPNACLLIEYGANINARTESGGLTALVIAAQHGLASVIETLLIRLSQRVDRELMTAREYQEHINFHSPTSHNRTALAAAMHHFLYHGSERSIELLLTYGAQVDLVAREDRPLLFVAIDNKNPKILQLIITKLKEQGCYKTHRKKMDVTPGEVCVFVTPLALAIHLKDSHSALVLLEAGVDLIDLSSVNLLGETALHLAALGGLELVIKAILQKMESLTKDREICEEDYQNYLDHRSTNGPGLTALEAVFQGILDHAQKERWDIAFQLLKAGASLDLQDPSKNYLEFFIMQAPPVVLYWLLEELQGRGLLHQYLNNPKSPLIPLSLSANSDTKTCLLLKHGAPFILENPEQAPYSSPLTLAIQMGLEESAICMLDRLNTLQDSKELTLEDKIRFLDLPQETDSAHTALFAALVLAEKTQNWKLVDRLVESGANVSLFEHTGSRRSTLSFFLSGEAPFLSAILLKIVSNLTRQNTLDRMLNHVTEPGKETGGTPLLRALKQRNFGIAEILLEIDTGAIFYQHEVFGDTALIVAAVSGNLHMVQLILEKVHSFRHQGRLTPALYKRYIDAHLATDSSATALILAARSLEGTNPCGMRIEEYRDNIIAPIALALLDAGASALPGEWNLDAPSLLHIFHATSHTALFEKCLQSLQKHKHFSEILAEKRRVPPTLFLALQEKRPENALLLLQYGDKVLDQVLYQSLNNESTPFILACDLRYESVALRILEILEKDPKRHLSYINARLQHKVAGHLSSISAFEIAVNNEFTSIVAILLRRYGLEPLLLKCSVSQKKWTVDQLRAPLFRDLVRTTSSAPLIFSSREEAAAEQINPTLTDSALKPERTKKK